MIRNKIFDEDPAYQATSENNVASVNNSLGEYNQVKELYEKAVMLFREPFYEYHTDLATGYNVIR